jgi:hypothetical protein
MMDLAKIGQAFLPLNSEFLSESAQHEIAMHIVFNAPVRQEFFCEYGLAMHQIEVSDVECQDRLFSDGLARIGHAGEAYGLRSGLWYSRATNKGFAYFTTAVPPRQSAEDEGGFDPREIELMAKAQELIEAGR